MNIEGERRMNAGGSDGGGGCGGGGGCSSNSSSTNIMKLNVHKAGRKEKEIRMSNRQTKAFVAAISKVIKNMR